MINLIFAVIAMALVGCGATSKKLVDLPPLAEDAPVQMFWSQPNIKYEKVCEIEAKGNNSFGGAYTKKEDFEPMFKKEARKCGANGVIFGWMHGYKQGSVSAEATGIKILGKEAVLTEENQIKAFSLAIQSRDFEKVKALLQGVPKSRNERAPSDDEMVNLGLYISTLDGLNCDEKIVSLFEDDYQAFIPKFKALNLHSVSKPDSNTPLCRGVIARSLPKMTDKTKAIVEVNNHYVGLLRMTYDKQLNEKAGKYTELLKVAANMIAEACSSSETDPVCATKGAYLNFANNSKDVKLSNVKQNANAVIEILK